MKKAINLEKYRNKYKKQNNCNVYYNYFVFNLYIKLIKILKLYRLIKNHNYTIFFDLI